MVARVAPAFDVWSGGRGAFIGLYREVAEQVRAGHMFITVPLGGGVEVTVTLDEPGQPVESAGFVPGIGVDQ